MKCKKKTKSIVVAAALLVLGIGVFYGYRFAEKLMAWRLLTSQESLHDLSPDAHQFKQAFNTAKGQVRVVMLVSPG